MTALRRTSIHGRRALWALLGLAIMVGLLIVFSGALTRTTDIETRADRARAEIAALELRAAAAEAEVTFIGTDEFILQQARSVGFGEPGEIAFALQAGAPSPEPIEPIGPHQAVSTTKAPFDAWMELLFGA